MIWLPATALDALSLARNLRASDVSELRFNCRATERPYDPEGEMLDAVARFEVWALWDGAELAGLAGVAPAPQRSDFGVIWFLGTPRADSHWRGMTRASRRFVQMQRRYWWLLGNVVPLHMVARQRWLRKLGFDIGNPEAQQSLKTHVPFWQQGIHGPKDEPAAP